jgi:putative endonuclease
MRDLLISSLAYINDAIAREKQIKGYSRSKKTKLINIFNPDWKDLHSEGKIINPFPEKKINP